MTKGKKILVGFGIPILILITLGALSSTPIGDRNQQQVAPQAPSPEPPKVEQRITCKGTARCFTAAVKNIVDGDTLDIGDYRVRLALVNTPERGEAGYAEATRFTTSTCPVGSEAQVDEDDGQKEGSFDRIVALVFCSSKNLNGELLVSKHAVIDSRFCSKSEFGNENWAIQGGCRLDGIAPVPQQPQQIPAPAPAATKHIVINEVEANPPGVDAGNEWVELFNPLTETIDLSGWRIVATHGVARTYIIPQGTSIRPGAHLVIQFTAQCIDNENEQLILIDRAGDEVDRTLPINDDINDQQTWQRRTDGLDNDVGSDWIFKAATLIKYRKDLSLKKCHTC